MSIFTRFSRRPADPSPTAQTPVVEVPALAEEPAPREAAPGLTVEMKLRGRKGGGEQEPGVEAAENCLAELQTRYRLGLYSGHPEEMLEDVELAEKAVQRLRTGTR